MKREDLKKLGLSDENIEAIMLLHGTTTENLKTAESQLEQANEQIKSLNDKVKNSANIDDLKGEMETLKSDYEKKLSSMQYEHEVTNYLSKLNFSNDLVKDAVTNKFKEQGFVLKEGKFLGADEYINQLKESTSSAFAEEQSAETKTGIKTNGIGSAGNGTEETTFKTFF